MKKVTKNFIIPDNYFKTSPKLFESNENRETRNKLKSNSGDSEEIYDQVSTKYN